MASPRLKWLRIHRYRNVAPGTYLEFNDGFNVLLGRNGTGKTTLLDLIEMIWTRGFGKIADENFQLEYAAAIEPQAPSEDPFDPHGAEGVPGCTIRVTVRNTIPERGESPRSGRDGGFVYQVVILNESGDDVFAVEASPLGARLRVGGQVSAVPLLTAASPPLLWSAPAQFFGPRDADGPLDPGRGDADHILAWTELCVFMLEHRPLATTRFDESLAGFQALTDINYQARDQGIEGVRWEIERRLDAETKIYPLQYHRFFNVPPSLVRSCQAELRKPGLREPEFHVSETTLPLLAHFVGLTTYAGARADLRPYERKRDGNVELLLFGPPDFHFMLPGNRGEIGVHALSYGEKRLLAFLWHLSCTGNVVIADELVNGFHHAWIERCVELIGDKQAFLASQNPLLLDCLPLKDEEYVRRCFITCRRGPETGGQMQWSNISAEEAAEFYRSYSRGTRYVHEILRGRGLW